MPPIIYWKCFAGVYIVDFILYMTSFLYLCPPNPIKLSTGLLKGEGG